MACFASALVPLLEGTEEKKVDILQKEISNIPEKYKKKWRRISKTLFSKIW